MVAIIPIIASELRFMRKLPGALDAAKIIQTKAILKGLGGGDPEEGLVRLQRVVQLHAGDQDIEAAFASLGFETVGESVLARLEEYAAENYIDARTARRRSDAGIEKIARLVVGTDPWLQPVALLQLSNNQGSTTVAAKIQITGPASVAMHEPALIYRDEPIRLTWGAQHRTQHGGNLKSNDFAIEVPGEGHSVLTLEWRGDLDPAFALDIDGGLPCSVQIRQLLRSLEVKLRVVEPKSTTIGTSI